MGHKQPVLSGHFISSGEASIFVTQFGSINHDTAILCLPSITEEMNLSRAIVAKTAKSLALNTPVFVLDYFGTGDSQGEFEQANTDRWLVDIQATCHWLKNLGIKKVIVWGVRFGALLALHAQGKIQEELELDSFIFWKPVTNGKQFAGQFLRIKQANALISNSASKVNWRQHILDGNNTEVSGYMITDKMLSSLEKLQITDEISPKVPVNWFELASQELAPISKKIIRGWPDKMVQTYSFNCPMFWQVPEVFSLPELTALTVEAAA